MQTVKLEILFLFFLNPELDLVWDKTVNRSQILL